jgi:hypothetical protein
MKRWARTILIGVLGLAICQVATAATRVYAKVNSDTTIYSGQTFTYSVVVEGGSRPSRIDISALAQFNPQRIGDNNVTQMVNGRTTITYAQNYAITAGQPGTMVLPGVTVVVDGQTYTTNPVEVVVSKAGTTDRMTLELSLSQRQCYVGQPLVMTVKWTVTAQVQDASFDVPVFKSDDFYIEDVSEQNDAMATQQVAIHNVPVTVTEHRQLVNGMEAAIISFCKVLIPKQPGHIVLDPISVSTSMAVGRVRTDDFFNPYRLKYERFTVQSDPVELDVQALPQANKPAQFYGLVGRYTISASASPTKVNVGDPITLTIRIGGNPYLKPVQWPRLEQIPGLGGNFKIPSEKASPVVENGEKVFTQTLRANSDSVTQIPPISLAYFDPNAGDYTLAATQAIPLEVAPTKVLTNADVQGATAGPVGREVEALREGFAANYDGPDLLTNQAFSPLSAVLHPAYAALWAIPLAGLLASVAFKVVTRSSPESVAAKRRRQACRSAVRRLKIAVGVDPKEAPDLLISAMKEYLGDRFDRTAGSLTADECRDIILSATGDAQLADRFMAKVSECEAARYASIGSQVGTAQFEEAIGLVRSVEEKTKR